MAAVADLRVGIKWPNDVMLELFDQWDGQPDKEDLRYVLTLLLIRRRVLRLEPVPCPNSRCRGRGTTFRPSS